MLLIGIGIGVLFGLVAGWLIFDAPIVGTLKVFDTEEGPMCGISFSDASRITTNKYVKLETDKDTQ